MWILYATTETWCSQISKLKKDNNKIKLKRILKKECPQWSKIIAKEFGVTVRNGVDCYCSPNQWFMLGSQERRFNHWLCHFLAMWLRENSFDFLGAWSSRLESQMIHILQLEVSQIHSSKCKRWLIAAGNRLPCLPRSIYWHLQLSHLSVQLHIQKKGNILIAYIDFVSEIWGTWRQTGNFLQSLHVLESISEVGKKQSKISCPVNKPSSHREAVRESHHPILVFRDFPHSSVGKESACNAGDLGWILGSRRFPGEGSGNPL